MITLSFPSPAKHSLAVWSAKGGVGKTFLAINLAYYFSKKGKTGLLDADITAPNVMALLNMKERHKAREGKLLPVVKDGIYVVSMGGLTEGALVWRGPMLTSAVRQFLFQTHWPKLEWMIIDMPPATSDVAITIAQLIKPKILLVTTPQKAALEDAKRTVDFAKKMSLEVVGVVENMVGEVFGRVEKEKIEELLNLPFLGEIPLDKNIREYVDKGIPLLATEYARLIESIGKELEKRM